MKSLLSVIPCMLLGWVLSLLGLPLAYMFGAMAAVIIASRLRISLTAPKHSLTVVQIVLGSSIGLMVKGLPMEEGRDILMLLPALLICLILQFNVGYFWFHRKMGWTRTESVLGAVPGALAAILVLTEHSKTPPQKIVISHAIRLVVLIIIAGIITGLNPPPVIEVAPFSYTPGIIGWLILIAAGGYIVGVLLERLHIPAPYMLTSLVVAIAVHYLSDVTLKLPELLSLLSMGLMGMRIGLYFSAFPFSALISNIWSSIQSVFIALTITVLVAAVTAQVMDYPMHLLILSWAPGSMEAMLFAAMAMKVNVGIVMASHIIRMSLLHIVSAIALIVQGRHKNS
ncbi:AbrB family transcriptional regulator [Xenorhabdus stockiae]|uniref:AbrB family transcriptional regulator n=1 Tax=Xenorhabdus stockiae TaxID=351614 RepID=UPI00406458D2